jgi:hypothetical protein
VVERSVGWLLRYRRLVRDYERRPEHHQAMMYWAPSRWPPRPAPSVRADPYPDPGRPAVEPGDPFLYDLRVTLTGTGGGDEVGGYFGLRSIATAMVNGWLRPVLNGRFVFQIGTLDQGYWPDGIYTAPTDEALRFDADVTWHVSPAWG